MRTVIVIFLFTSLTAPGQQSVTLDSVIAASLGSHPKIHAAHAEVSEQQALKRGSFSLPDPTVFVASPDGDGFTPGVEQKLDNPLVYVQQSKLGKERVTLAEQRTALTRADVVRQVSNTYTTWQFAIARYELLRARDSVFRSLREIAERRHTVGEAGLIEKTSAVARSEEFSALLVAAEAEVSRATNELLRLIGSSGQTLMPTELTAMQADITATPGTSLWNEVSGQMQVVAMRDLSLQQAKWAPGLALGYLNEGDASTPFEHRLYLGITVPLWFWTHASEVKAARAALVKARYENALTVQQYDLAWQEAMSNYSSTEAMLQYYETSGAQQAAVLLDAASRTYAAGEIGYIEYLSVLSQVFDIRAKHLEALRDHNLAVIQLQYLQSQ